MAIPPCRSMLKGHPMKTPCYVMLVCYVEGYMDWNYCQTDDELKFISDYLLGDPAEQFVRTRYCPEQHSNTYIVDADELLIIKDTLEECIDEAFLTTKELCLGRYIDGISWDEDIQKISFNEYLKPFMDELQKVSTSEDFKHGTLKDYVAAFS